MSMWLIAGFWGLVSGSALVVGTILAYAFHLPQRVVAAVMAFGSGVLISALSFELMAEAYKLGGFLACSVGFLGGAAVYTAANVWVSRRGAHCRKRSGHQQKKASEGGGVAIAIGSLLDGIPESAIIGVSLLEGKGVNMVAVIAIFLSNIPEGLSSSAGMRKAGRSTAYVFGLWIGITLLLAVAAALGNLAFAHSPPAMIAAIQAVAAGAILSMLVDTMIPEAFEVTHEFAGLITVSGFLIAFALSKMGG
ncbi:MAG: ZIP family metal transporter [Solirubrobacterales bacterium]